MIAHSLGTQHVGVWPSLSSRALARRPTVGLQVLACYDRLAKKFWPEDVPTDCPDCATAQRHEPRTRLAGVIHDIIDNMFSFSTLVYVRSWCAVARLWPHVRSQTVAVAVARAR